MEDNKLMLLSKVKKSNNFIMAHFKMSVYEQKIIVLCISKIKSEAKKTTEDENINLSFSLVAKEIVEFLKLESRGIYSELNSIANRLTTHRIYISNGKDFKYIVPIPFCEYKDGIFTLRFDKSMQDYLLELKDKFTVYNIENIRKLKSNYSIRIYEILKSYEWLGDCIFDLMDFKRTIGIVEEDSRGNILRDLYKTYADLKRKVLKLAQKELSLYTDIKFDFEEIKTGRKVTALKFEIQKNLNSTVEQIPIPQTKKEIKIQPIQPPIDEDELMDELRSFIVEPIKTKDLRAILKTAHNDVQLIKSKYELANRQSKIENLIAWLISAIENDFSEPVGKKKQNKFINYEQGDWDFEKLERLEREYIDKKLGE